MLFLKHVESTLFRQPAHQLSLISSWSENSEHVTRLRLVWCHFPGNVSTCILFRLWMVIVYALWAQRKPFAVGMQAELTCSTGFILVVLILQNNDWIDISSLIYAHNFGRGIIMCVAFYGICNTSFEEGRLTDWIKISEWGRHVCSPAFLPLRRGVQTLCYWLHWELCT